MEDEGKMYAYQRSKGEDFMKSLVGRIDITTVVTVISATIDIEKSFSSSKNMLLSS